MKDVIIALEGIVKASLPISEEDIVNSPSENFVQVSDFQFGFQSDPFGNIDKWRKIFDGAHDEDIVSMLTDIIPNGKVEMLENGDLVVIIENLFSIVTDLNSIKFLHSQGYF